MNKRQWMMGGVALCAGALGAAWGWWRLRPHELAPDALEQLWTLTFDDPSGQLLAMANFQGQPLLINFWATWCPPCVEEMPLLNTFYQAQRAKGWQVLGLAVDQPSAVQPFVQRMGIAFPIGIAGLPGTELSRALGNHTGALPFTVLLNADGQVVQRKLGQLHAQDLAAWAAH